VQQTADKGMSSGRFTKKEESQPKAKRQLEGNLNRGSCHSFYTADLSENRNKHSRNLGKWNSIIFLIFSIKIGLDLVPCKPRAVTTMAQIHGGHCLSSLKT
jgi:hypothetical protein